MDSVHHTWGGFLYARGENTDTHTRYHVVSIPIWLPVLVASALIGLGLTHRLIS